TRPTSHATERAFRAVTAARPRTARRLPVAPRRARVAPVVWNRLPGVAPAPPTATTAISAPLTPVSTVPVSTRRKCATTTTRAQPIRATRSQETAYLLQSSALLRTSATMQPVVRP